MATLAIRAMSVGEILDGAFAIYRRIFGVLVSIAIVFQGIPQLLNIYVQQAGGVLQVPLLSLAAWVLATVAGILAAGAMVWAISQIYLGHDPGLGDALRQAMRKAWKLLVAGIGKYIVMSLGLIILIVPGIIVACGYAVVTQIVMLENVRRSLDALGRSWALTRGHKTRALVLGFVVYLLLALPTLAGGALVAFIPGLLDLPGAETLMQVAPAIIGLLLYPITACAFTLFYYDLRVRKEAFDLEHLSRQLGEAPAHG